MKTNEKTTTAATADYGITTGGEVFADGVIIELIGGAHPGNPQLMLWVARRSSWRRPSSTTVSGMNRQRSRGVSCSN
jgi:hypothetical protein